MSVEHTAHCARVTEEYIQLTREMHDLRQRMEAAEARMRAAHRPCLRPDTGSGDSVPSCGGPSACWACFTGAAHPRPGERVPFPAETAANPGPGDHDGR